jgi:hypothetical protein
MKMKPISLMKRLCLLGALGVMTMANSGCLLVGDFWHVAWIGATFYKTTPIIPVNPY